MLKFQKIMKEGKIYRGETPFLLNKIKGVIVYVASSRKNLNDYYWVLKDIYNGEIVKQWDESEEEYLKFSYTLQDKIEKNERFIVLMTLDYLLKDYIYKGDTFELSLGKNVSQLKIIDFLDKDGYEKNYMVEKVGDFSIRGDILDFFPRNSENPIRIEFFHNEIERIVYFDLETQRTIKKINDFKLYINSKEDRDKTFLGLFKDLNGKKIKVEYILENIEVLQYKLMERIDKNKEEREKLVKRFNESVVEFKKLEHKNFTVEDRDKFQNLQEIKKISKEKKIVVCSEESRRYKELLDEFNNIKFYNYPLFEGFENNGVLYLSDRELKGIPVKREKTKKNQLKRKTDLNEINIGDYIIHETFGIGRYQGLMVIDSKEYLELKYADQDKLFISINNLDRIEKYPVEYGKEPEVYKLGKKGFRRRKEKLVEEMAKFAMEVIEVQAKRSLGRGFKYERDSILQEEFEEGFPYTLTPDQKNAIDDVKHDMETDRIMDRIICGDVGCGKTEIAMRAAFKAIEQGRQVVVLAPTTILAQQHYERFRERLKNYPFTVELLTRVRSKKESQQIEEQLLKGGIDIVIGTHKLLSEELKFKNLALGIIDEEQKFGVKAKEKLKNLKEKIDMLTLTATPIPRTLNLALLGIRDISIISTLPPNRIPIKDFYMENTNENIKEAILKEFTREGQTYYLYNSVKKMEKKRQELQSILPGFIKILTVHGQMEPKEISRRIKAFENGEIDLLLTTTIIENGIDIENANTILIDGLEKLGLSQLYQLRGRVGRGGEQGYCYILEDKNKELKSRAKERENSLKTLDGVDAGGGLHLSMEDMKIRGAGELLGDKQHGTINTLGYSLYMKLLHEEMDKINGKYIEEIPELEIELKDEGYIPSQYIEGKERLKIYKRVAEIKVLDDLSEIENELKDRFGDIPKVAKNYLYKEKIRIMATRERFLKVLENKDGIYIKFIPEDVKFNKILEIIKKGKAKYMKEDNAIIYLGTVDEFFDYYSGL